MADNFWPIPINPMALGADESTLPGGAGWENANLLPIQKNRKTGQWAWGMPNSLAAALSGIMAPGKAANGLYERMIDPTTGVNYYDGMLGDVSNLAGMLTLGGGAIPKPKGSLGIFGGEMALTADKTALETAKKMAADGANRDEIWNATGWFKGKDDKWRFEIPDDAATFTPPANSASMPGRLDVAEKRFTELTGKPGMQMWNKESPERTAALQWADDQLLALREQASGDPLSSVLSHSELYKNYPELKDILTAKETINGYAGAYNNGRLTYGGHGIIADSKVPSPRSVILHELQHGVQQKEGFGQGGNLGTGKYYKTLEIANLEDARDSLLATANAQPTDEARQFFASKAAAVDQKIERMAAKAYYERLSGEVEARNVQARMDLTPEQRRAKAPWKTQDVPDDLQIVRMRGN